MHGTLISLGFDIQDSFYEYTISAKDKQGTWSAIASGKYDPSIAHQHTSWTTSKFTHGLKFSEPNIGRSPKHKQNVLVVRDFRLDETLFTDVKVDVRYLPNKIDSDGAATLSVTRKDAD